MVLKSPPFNGDSFDNIQCEDYYPDELSIVERLIIAFRHKDFMDIQTKVEKLIKEIALHNQEVNTQKALIEEDLKELNKALNLNLTSDELEALLEVKEDLEKQLTLVTEQISAILKCSETFTKN